MAAPVSTRFFDPRPSLTRGIIPSLHKFKGTLVLTPTAAADSTAAIGTAPINIKALTVAIAAAATMPCLEHVAGSSRPLLQNNRRQPSVGRA